MLKIHTRIREVIYKYICRNLDTIETNSITYRHEKDTKKRVLGAFLNYFNIIITTKCAEHNNK